MSDTQPDKPSQTDRDTARAQSRLSDSRTFKSGGESRNAATARDTARAQSRLSDSRTFKSGGESRNAATARDTERAASRVTHSAGYADRIEASNAAALSVPDEPAPHYGQGTEEFKSADTPYFGGGGGGGTLPGMEIIWVDQTSTYIRADDLLAGYDPDTHLYWSLVVPVSLGVSDPSNLTYDSTEALFENDGGTPPEQTTFRVRLITQGTDANGDPLNVPLSVYGQYRETTTVIDGELYQCLIKVT